MKITQALLDRLTEQAKASPRLRMNLDLRIPAGQWHTVQALESGTVIMEVKDGAYEPLQDVDILTI